MACDVNELRSLFLFEKLDDDQLAWLCREGRVELFPPGPVYTEGEPGDLLLRHDRGDPGHDSADRR